MSGFQFSVVVATTERLDRFLADQLQLSRSHAARLVAAGHVRVDDAVARASRHLAYRECVTVELPDATPLPTLKPAAIPITVVYEDDALAVIDKPAGLVVHPAPGHWDDTLVNALVARGTTLGGGAEGRPGIVHRLDRDTSGLMLVAKHEVAHRRLADALASTRHWCGDTWQRVRSSSTPQSHGIRRTGSGWPSWRAAGPPKRRPMWWPGSGPLTSSG